MKLKKVVSSPITSSNGVRSLVDVLNRVKDQSIWSKCQQGFKL